MTKPEEITVKIQSSEPNSDQFPPIVGYFPSHYDPLKDKNSETVKIYKNVNRSNRYKVTVTPNGSDVEFIGTNYDGEASAPQLSSYSLAVFDKNTGVLKLLPIAGKKIFRLAPKVGEGEEIDDAPKTALTKEERFEALKDLQIQFSTRKAEREHKKRSALRVTEDDETRKDLDRTMESIKVHEEAQEGAGSSFVNGRNVPHYDLAATDPRRAYPLEKIIVEGEWEYLLDVFSISQGNGEVTPDVYPTFVCNRVHKLERIQDVNEKRKLAGILSYISNLIRFKDKCSMDGVRSSARHKIPSILLQKFSSMFSDPESRLLSVEKIELLIGYVLVLTLHVDDFRTDFRDIAQDLRKPPYALRSCYQTLGCKLVYEKLLPLATLPVPLTFPETTKRKRRRKQ